MKFLKHSAAFVLGFFLVAGSVFAQGQQMQPQQPDSISDEELESFAHVTNEVQKINQESQKKVQSMLEDKDMDMQRFQVIMQSQQNPKMADSVNVTEEEQKTIDEMEPKLMKMQQNSRQKMMDAMQENDLNPKRFQTIMRAVQSDQAVAQRFQKIAQETMQN